MRLERKQNQFRVKLILCLSLLDPITPDHTRNYTTRLSNVLEGGILQVFIPFARMAYFT